MTNELTPLIGALAAWLVLWSLWFRPVFRILFTWFTVTVILAVAPVVLFIYAYSLGGTQVLESLFVLIIVLVVAIVLFRP